MPQLVDQHRPEQRGRLVTEEPDRQPDQENLLVPQQASEVDRRARLSDGMRYR